jgi:hypothetical protein
MLDRHSRLDANPSPTTPSKAACVVWRETSTNGRIDGLLEGQALIAHEVVE